MSDSELNCTPPDVLAIAKTATNDLIPTKSSRVYNHAYERFLTWCNEKNITNYSENVLLAYFCELATNLKMKSSTMWSQYSMIKALLNLKHGLDISKYMKLRAYLKKQNEGYTPKKSKVFTKEQFEDFLNNAPDEQYLGIKVVLVIGVSGACRCDEMVNMTIDNIEDLGSVIHIKIPDSKTKKPRSFTIIGEKYINLYRKYTSLRPPAMESRRFFLKFQNGKCYRMVMGIHTISNVPKTVATFLKLPDSKLYTGHALRRTSATLLVNGGADITCLKRHGGWRSSTVAEGYLEDSLSNKKETAKKILMPNSSSLGLNAASDERNSVDVDLTDVETSKKSKEMLLANSFNSTQNSIELEVNKSGSVLNLCGATLNNCNFTINM
ncbi:uncharacterized protein LOC116181409 isoform X2 [Photinus pyralis]|nr:uncharacterized protein LOC116158727 isoform X1 [Photinus pyralis]XP_031357631.1 uncharacterized protein LOC116181409 isoform X2 [Photinus pyralis]XP_031357632.1 uncharacterized protein LOC116181409 isoform X2 [Photinus pyralis]